MGAQTDLLSVRTREISAMERRGQIWRKILSGSREENPVNYRLASPLFYLDKNDPPCWFISGEKDDASTHADLFRQRSADLGIQSGLTVVQDAPHPFLGRQAWFDQMVERSDAFFSTHLKNQKTTPR